MHKIGRWMKRQLRREVAQDLGRLGEGERLAATMEQLRRPEQRDRLVEQLERVEAQLADAERRLDRLFSAFVDGDVDRYSQRAFDKQRRQLVAEIERLEAHRDDLAGQLASDAERSQKLDNLAALLQRMETGLAAADEDFNKRRQLIEVLDVVVHLERDGDTDPAGHSPGGPVPGSTGDARAYIDVDGERLAKVDLPDTRRPGWEAS